MTIKQVEEALGIPKATIRFYEKEGLIAPTRRENGYRDYSEADVRLLRQVVIFRKLGLSVEQIADLQDGSTDLQEALEQNMVSLRQQVEELNGAMTICREMQADHAQLETFDGEKWWERIHDEESRGNRFLGLARDYVEFQGAIMEELFAGREPDSKAPVSWKNVLVGFAAVMIMLCLFFGKRDGFAEIISTVVGVATLTLLFRLPEFFLKRAGKVPAAKSYRTWLQRIAIALGGLVILWVTLCVANGRWHFMW